MRCFILGDLGVGINVKPLLNAVIYGIDSLNTEIFLIKLDFSEICI